jgi:hypothetical protein
MSQSLYILFTVVFLYIGFVRIWLEIFKNHLAFQSFGLRVGGFEVLHFGGNL